jgi:hypothetical protein
LSNSEDSYEKSINDEQEKKRRKRYKEWNDRYWWNVFCQNYHNEGHLTKECKFLQTICNIYRRRGHETNDYPLKELGGQYVRKDIPINVIQPKTFVKHVKQDQSS